MNDYQQTMTAIIAVQFIGFLLIFIWTKTDDKKNN
tara:strand:+ start:109 stop:213 length:105 start_codon:yes stop_codon:yes gene_type:complete